MRLLYQICKNIAGCTIKSAKYDWRSAAIYEILFWHLVHEFRDRQWDGKLDARKPILDSLRPDSCPGWGSWTEKRPLDKCLDEWKWCQTNLQRKNVNRDENKETMLQKLSKCEVKARLCWNLIMLPPLRFCVKSNFGEFKQSKNVDFDNFRGSQFWF